MNSSFVVVGLLAFLSGGPSGYEEPVYEVVGEHADFEVRQYAPRIVARAVVHTNFDEAGSAAFPALREYIATHEIAMTVPVTQSGSEGSGYSIEFGMPAVLDYEELPVPDDENVELVVEPEKMVAALAYRGDWNRGRYERHESRLVTALAAEGLRPIGEPIWARYNSPLMIWFLRRNEVLIPVAPIYDTRAACGASRG